VIALLAAIPAVALGALSVYASGKSDEVSVPVTSTTVPAALPAVLSTPLLSARRAPAPLVSDRREDLLLDAVQALTASVDGASCMAVGMNDRVVAGANTSTPVIPASNLKVVIAAAAVDILGSGTVFTTKVVGPAPVNGVIDGDVYLVGGGDPVLSEQWYTEITPSHVRPPLNATSAEALADALAAAGVTSITGSVVGDGSRYDDERHPPGWSDEIRATLDGVAVGALVVNDSVSRAGALGSDPAASAAGALTRLLRDRAITVSGDPGTGVAPVEGAALATVTSQPLSAIVNEMLVTSDNLTAEMLVKEIGFVAAGKGTRVDGLQAVVDRLGQWGIPAAGLVLVDGSGLSRENRLTCDTLLAVLQRGTATDVLGSGLATAGQDGSTLDGKFEQEGLAGVLQAKTGSLREVKALCGYYTSGADEMEFVLILNGASASAFDGPWGLLGAALLAANTAPPVESVALTPS
jgi:D-alanyl-D-alanine carboxypeptidase/D-alanyl-D-alanine-endopeptidase (penicillin-binding protein 4)